MSRCYAGLAVAVLSVVLLLLSHGAWADFVLGDLTLLESPPNLGPPFSMFEGDFHPRISTDGLALYLASSRPGGYGNQDLWVATRTTRDAPWSLPENLGPLVNSGASDYYPGISPDGLSLYFYSWRTGTSGGSDIWVATRVNSQASWTAPVHLPWPVNSSNEDRDPSISADGLTLYFSSDRNGKWDIWKATRPSTDTWVWSEAVPLDAPINTSSGERYPHLSADGLSLCLTSSRPGGYGSGDLYVAHRASVDQPWGEPENLGDTLNTPYFEYAHSITGDGLELYLTMDGRFYCATRASTSEPFGEPVPLSCGEFTGQFSADGLAFYFSSDRGGGCGYSDIWITHRDSVEAPWQEPVNLGPAVNSNDWEWAPSLSPDGLELYFGSDHASEPDGSNIWVSTRSSVTEPWGQAVSLGVVNSVVMDYHPAISADKLTLVFASRRPGGVGQDNADLWMTQRPSVAEPWGEPVNLGTAINTAGHDQWPSFSADGRWLFYSSVPVGGPYNEMLAVPRLADGRWGPARRLLWNVLQPDNVLGPTPTPDGSSLYVWSNVPGGFGDSDLWQLDLVPLVDLNGDGRLDQGDERVLQRHWGQDERSCDIGPGAIGDGVIDEQDLAVLRDYLGTDVNDPTLVSHWPLDETDGSTASDRVGGRDGTFVGEPLWQPEAGMIDGALAFDGIDDCVVTARGFDLTGGPFSVFAYVKGGAPGQVILSQIGGVDWLAADPVDGRLTTELEPPAARGVVTPELLSETIITDGQWHRVGFIWDGASRIICVDDAESVCDVQTQLKGSDGRLCFGAGSEEETAGALWLGLIDDIRIYNRAVKP